MRFESEYAFACSKIPEVANSMQVSARDQRAIFMKWKWIDSRCMALLQEQLLLSLDVPQSPSLIMRTRGYMPPHRMVLHIICRILMTLQRHALLVVVWWIQTPKFDRIVSRCWSQICLTCWIEWFARFRMKSYWNNPIRMTFESSLELTPRYAPDLTVTTPPRCCKQVLIRVETASWHTSVVCVLWLNYIILPYRVQIFL